jgi:hypothetical protein
VRMVIGLILMLVGGAVILYGIAAALSQLFGLYQGAVDNAMGMSATAEQEASKGMMRAVIVGACGVPVFLVGSMLLKVSVFQRMRARGKK